jgi:hypothetical protein
MSNPAHRFEHMIGQADDMHQQAIVVQFYKCLRDPAGELLVWEGESQLAGAREGHLAQLFRAAGLHEVQESALSVSVEHPSFDDWWEPFTFGVGPAGSHAAGLDATRQARLRELCREMLPAAPFAVTALAWAARGLV